MQADDNQKRKMLALLVVLSGKVAGKTQLNALVEEVTKMGNVIIDFMKSAVRSGEKKKSQKNWLQWAWIRLTLSRPQA